MPESAHLDSEANNGSSSLVPKKCRKQSVKVRQRFFKCVPLLSIKPDAVDAPFFSSFFSNDQILYMKTALRQASSIELGTSLGLGIGFLLRSLLLHSFPRIRHSLLQIIHPCLRLCLPDRIQSKQFVPLLDVPEGGSSLGVHYSRVRGGSPAGYNSIDAVRPLPPALPALLDELVPRWRNGWSRYCPGQPERKASQPIVSSLIFRKCALTLCLKRAAGNKQAFISDATKDFHERAKKDRSSRAYLNSIDDIRSSILGKEEAPVGGARIDRSRFRFGTGLALVKPILVPVRPCLPCFRSVSPVQESFLKAGYSAFWGITQNLDPLYDVLVEPLGYDALLLEYHGMEYPDLPKAPEKAISAFRTVK
ncbi:hypothetical protein WN944_023865 [Citrus x changshan-huyou]|uniref:Uncharacterized protein n=1 Tax=Citrus x changshan-huyou TaxID=2935761 RepID=A0AAP0LRB6_9ROSI